MATKKIDLNKVYTKAEIDQMWHNMKDYDTNDIISIGLAHFKSEQLKDGEGIKFLFKYANVPVRPEIMEGEQTTNKEQPKKLVYKMDDVSLDDIKARLLMSRKSKPQPEIEEVIKPRLFTLTELATLAADSELPDEISRCYFIMLNLAKAWAPRFEVPAGAFKFYFDTRGVCKAVFPKAIYKGLKANDYIHAKKRGLVICIEEHEDIRAVRAGCVYQQMDSKYDGHSETNPTHWCISVDGVVSYDEDEEEEEKTWWLRINRFHSPKVASNLYQMMKAFYRQEREQAKILNCELV